MKFRKKPVVIEAFQMTQAHRNDNQNWPGWLHEAWNRDPGEGSLFIDSDDPERQRLCVGTKEGVLKVVWGAWIVRGIQGEIYPVEDDIFRATYDPVPAHEFDREALKLMAEWKKAK